MELVYQALYLYRAVIGWINQVEIVDQPITAQIDSHSCVKIGKEFKEEYLKKAEDIAFILSHESAHKYVALLLASDFELNVSYSRLVNKGWESNFLEDLLINQSQFHAIPSNLPERYYLNCEEWSLVFLQRNLKAFDRLTNLNDKQKAGLDYFKLCCNQWYQTNELPLLFEVFKSACNFLDLFEVQKSKNSMVTHETEAESSGGAIGFSKGSGTDRLLLKIPYITDFKLARSWKLESLSKNIEKFSAEMSILAKRIQDNNGIHRTIGYSCPTEEELICWDSEIYVPWTEPLSAPQSQDIHLVFDVSGSMFQYLSALSAVKESLKDFTVHWYAFSSHLTEIVFRTTWAEVETSFGTNLTDVLALLSRLDPANIVIVSDGQWTFDQKKYPVEYAERLVAKHKTTLLQASSSEVRLLSKSVFEVIAI